MCLKWPFFWYFKLPLHVIYQQFLYSRNQYCFIVLKETFKIGSVPRQSFIALMASQPKKMNPSKIIGTHNGTFHCDEVLACCMLKMLPEYDDAKIVRTRDENVLKTCDIVVDVGGEYEPLSHRYDHHQRYTYHEATSGQFQHAVVTIK